MYREDFMSILDEIAEPSEAGQRPSMPDSVFYSAAGKLIKDKCALTEEQVGELVLCLSALPGSPSAAAQSLAKWRHPVSGQRSTRTISI